jgi:cobalt-zinc-cadmium resistance protein CzcA
MTTETPLQPDLLERVLRCSLKNRIAVLLCALLLAVIGIWSFRSLLIDAVPDITNVQVQINTEAPGYTPLEVEQRITLPLENSMAGLARLEHTRSLSRYGLSQVTVIFEDGTDLFFARQQVAERLQSVGTVLPAGIDPQMGPAATGLGEIFMYTVDAAAPPDSGLPGIDGQTLRSSAVAARGGCCRCKHDRRIAEAVPGAAGSTAAARLRRYLAGPTQRAGAKQL